jgi:hypothetical protein
MSARLFLVNSGFSSFRSKLRHWSMCSGVSGGFALGIMHTGIERKRPAIGGEKPVSRARYAITPAKFAPEKMPPIRKPAVGEA